MNRIRPIWQGLTVTVAACSVAAACAVTSAAVSQTPTTPSATTVTTATATTVATTNATGGGGGNKVAPTLPADFPAAVQLYPGVLQGSTGRSPRWGVLIFVRAGAASVQKSAIAFYVARGYHADSAATVHNATYRLTMLAANRDHSATQTDLIIAVAKL